MIRVKGINRSIVVPVCLLALLFPVIAFGQVPDAKKYLVADAKKMGDAFLKKKYSAFVSYVLPAVTDRMGGKENASTITEKMINDMNAAGIHLEEITFGDAMEIYKVGRELHSSIMQYMRLRSNNGPMYQSSVLVAISTDNGVHWKFLDSSRKTRESVKQFIPNLSDNIIIPTPIN